jgi:two-component system sensor histidine kinase RpfC
MDGYATKPIEPIQLLKVIDEVLSRRDVQQAAVQTVESSPPIVPDKTEGPINLNVLAELERLGGRDFVAGLINQFSNDAADLLASLRAAVMDEGVQRFRDAAHALRGSAANLGASMVFETCLALRAITPRQLAVEGDAQVTQLIKETGDCVTLLKAHIAGTREQWEPTVIRRKIG